MHTQNDSCDRESIASRDELEREAREAQVLLDETRRHERMLTERELAALSPDELDALAYREAQYRFAEWQDDYEAGHAA